jgi:methionyl-tRNA formyltransferase
MKIVLFSGSHPRHLFLHKMILENFDVVGVIVYERENFLPSPPENASESDQTLFRQHFKERDLAEEKYFKKRNYSEVFNSTRHLVVKSNQELNSEKVGEFIKELDPDMAVIFGTTIIKDPIFSLLPVDKINIHLGLSPWYRGSATLFWPFYNMEPNHAGVTIHQITAKADAGDIIHQCVPELDKHDGIHDVACKAVLTATRDLKKVLSYKAAGKIFPQQAQKQSGRLYLSKSFKPEHLRVNYEVFNNRMVKAYLNKDINPSSPKLIRLPSID